MEKSQSLQGILVFSVYVRDRMDVGDNEWVFLLEVIFYLNDGQKY